MNFPPPTPNQARIFWMSVTALAIGIFLALLGLVAWGVGWLLRILAPVVWPLAIAGIIAYLLDPVVDYFESRRVPRGRAILLVFVMGLGAVLAVAGQVLPRLIFETKQLIEDIPQYSMQVQTNVTAWVARRPFLEEWKDKLFQSKSAPAPAPSTNAPAGVMGTNVQGSLVSTNITETVSDSRGMTPDRIYANQAVQTAIGWLAKMTPKVGQWILNRLSQVASWAGMIVGLALVPVFAFYLLLEKRGIQRAWRDYLPLQESKFKQEVVFVLTAINDYMIVFFRGQFIVAMCIGGLLTVGFLAIGLHYAVLLGVLAGVLSIVPYLGAILTIIPSVALAAIQFKDWLHPLIVVGIFAAVQSLEGLVISPKIMGDRVGLHPLTIIIAVLVGTNLMGGILGGILAIPLTAALRVIMFRYIWKQPKPDPA